LPATDAFTSGEIQIDSSVSDAQSLTHTILSKTHREHCTNLLSPADLHPRLLPPNLTSRPVVIAQLRNVEVYSAEEVIVEWTIGSGNNFRQIKGRVDSGRVKLTQDGNILKIIMRESDVEVARPTLELREEMTKFCGITDPAHVAILHWILAEDDLKDIERVLERRGIPNDVPEFDELPQDGNGIRLSFSGLKAKVLGGESENTSSRRYKSRKKANRASTEKSESADAVQDFVKKFDLTNAFGKKITQSWRHAEAKNMLSHICRLENMDPFMLLPQRDNPWTRQVRKAGGYPDDYVGVFFDGKPTTRGVQHTKGSQTFPAIVRVAGESLIHVGVSTTANDLTDEEILFTGELYVGTQMVNATLDLTSNTT
jgi:hypothetical protein